MTTLEAPLQQHLQDPRFLTESQVAALRAAIRLVPLARPPQDLLLHLQHPNAAGGRGEIRAAAFDIADPEAAFAVTIEAWIHDGKGSGAEPEEVLKVSVIDGEQQQDCYVDFFAGDAAGWGYGAEYEAMDATSVHDVALGAIATWALWSSSHLSPAE